MKKILLLLALFIGYLTSQAQTVLTIENQNIVNTDPNWQGYNVPHDVKTTLTFRNNAITSVNTSMYLLQSGDDYPATTINNLDGAVITGNKLTWNGTQTGSIITHGLFVGYNINQTVKWNSLTNVPYNIIFKSGASAAPNMNITAGAASYNIVKGGRFAGRCKGINGTRFYNNTFYGDAGSWYLLLINANSDGAPTYPGNPSINTKVKNNIFYTTTKTPAISIDAGSRTGFECDYNVYWCEAGDNTPVFLVGGTSYTWAQWKALGYDAHSVVVNPNFNNTTAFVPAARLNYGTDLGPEFNTGLSTSATWVVGSTPATQVQNGTWQVGARIYAPSTIVIPTVTTTSISNVATTTAIGGGNVTSDGGASVTDRGVCWSTSTNPTTSNSKTTDGTGMGSFTSSITGLTQNTTYYVRSYATNSTGTSYGSQISFTTIINGAATYYVKTYADGGRDESGRNGSIGQEWATIGYACTRVTTAGSIIDVAAGTYNVSSQISVPVNVSIRGSMTSTTLVNTTYVNTNDNTGGVFLLNGGTNTNQSISYLTIDGNRTGWIAITAYSRNNVSVHHCHFIDMEHSCVTFMTTGLNNSFHDNTAVNSSGAVNMGDYGDRGANIRIKRQTGFLIYNNVLSQAFREDPDGKDIGVCIIAGYDQPSSGDHTIYDYMYCNDCKIYNNTITWPVQNDIGWYFAFEMWLQRGLEIYNNRVQGLIDICHSYPQNTYPIASSVKYNVYVHNNTFGFNTLNSYRAYGIEFEGMNTQIIIANNLFKNLSQGLYFCNYHNFWEVFDINEKIENIWIYGNIFQNIGFADYNFDHTMGVYFQNGSVDSGDPTAHPVYSCSNINILNNTFKSYVTRRSHSAISLPCQATNSTVTNINVRNNIMIGFDVAINSATISRDADWTGPQAISYLTFQDNITHDCTDDYDFTGITLTNSTTETGVTNDPLFINETGFNFHLASTSSPAYHAGLSIAPPFNLGDYDGVAWNNPPSMGAYEYTGSVVIPTVTTNSINSITTTTASGGGNVTSDGGASVTVRGICWNTSTNPTISNSKTSDGTGTGTFTSNITSLTPNTLYYVRAYATNSAGTAYGNQVSFTTSQIVIIIPTITTTAVSSITTTTATSGGNILSDGGGNVTVRGICWSISTNPTITNSHTSDGTGIGSFTSSMTTLTPGTIYHIRSYATNSAGTAYGTDLMFTTNEIIIIIPTVTTTSITNITITTATGGGNASSDGGGTITDKGVCWSTSINPTIANSHTSDGTGTGVFNSNITGLSSNTLYYVRAYATNSVGTAYGNQVSFTTDQIIVVVIPTVTTTAITNITTTTATSGGNVISDGNSNVTSRGICWSTSINPTITNSHTSDGTGMGAFTSNLITLTPNTLYYVRAYATNSVGIAYGNEVSFTTSQIAVVIPTITTAAISSITTTTATSGGNISSDGGGTVTAKGVCWSTTTSPTITNSHTSDGAGTGTFTSNITELLSNTLYYVRSYATNSAGTAYGNQVSFTTNQIITTPTFGSLSITDITTTTATGNCSISSDGNATVTNRGVCWSTTTSPTITNSHTSDGTGIGAFTSNITGLSPNTLYYARAYATNNAGTSYSSQIMFTTNQIVVIPTVTTASIIYITTTTATGGGNVTSDGGGTITARGVCWSTSGNPTIVNNKTSDGTGTGNFTSFITGLSSNTYYYVRAYATNSAGTAYGSNVEIFQTSQIIVKLIINNGNVIVNQGKSITNNR